MTRQTMRWLSNKIINRANYMDEDHIIDNYSHYVNAQAYLTLHEELKQKSTLKATTNVTLYDSKNSSLTPRSVRRLLGKPNTKLISRHCTKNVLIYFYRKLIAGHKAKIELHFIGNKLFFYNYRFSHLGAKDKTLIKESLEEKYLDVTDFDSQNSYIIDVNKSIISISEGVEFSLEYIVNSSEFNKIVTYAQTQKEMMQHKLHQESIVFQKYL